ncbi:Ankyrin repeat-containing protein [Oryctes borbonicus]|uniref:Ankyrin repeat-containing protein n=1 Tax=Oryctes borbonicus TaxID=1629725 RepID=A0A0T6B078_9SCAR|nr:Ankyrin repeat-containing protein [Oryctes borbonicus]
MLSFRVDEIRELLKLPENKCDALNHRKETPLYLSLKNKCSDEMILLFIDHGADIHFRNRKGVTPLHLAVQRRNPNIVTKLIEKGASVNLKDDRNGCTPLHIAIAQGRYHNVEELFKWRASTETRNCFGQAPLVYGLCKESGDRIISTLIDHGCDVGVSDNKGFTSLHYASYKKSTFIAQKLIEKGADINFRSHDGNTPLHMGVREDNLEYVCLLLCYGASVNEPNCLGSTPFHEALSKGYEEIAEYLLGYITDFNIQDKYDNTYLSLSIGHHISEIVKDLLDECDVNILSEGEHSLCMAVRSLADFSNLQIIWSKTDFDVFIPSCERAFLDDFCTFHAFAPNDEFIQFLYMMFDSPYIEDLLDQRHQIERDVAFIRKLFDQREELFEKLNLSERLEIILVLLSYGVDVYFEDIYSFYLRYGFNEIVELLLMSGCYIYYGSDGPTYSNLLVSRMCYNNLDLYIDTENMKNKYQKLNVKFDKYEENEYCEFYRATFDELGDSCLILHGISSKGEVSSLLEISRNVVRNVLYQTCRTSCSFNVYSAISKLPIPSVIKDILYLKRPIYI